ncbi:unnamed protein product [Didymodactylos carnosus]|uniref:ADP-ribosylhydrolase ARH3 n=1 Tax=Didymodactylos carnosus TaxID=1234261 RepID=A0A814WFN7_9BILA|nr:unnamed protein product [Didymodactylos carnosus]CAF1202560.1 unnamed protein product [Didymodactylos carnosus]CAF3965326.1 unnamed protein product [Didymodactylos carnosus]CAF4012341.1 unnamed protein product [Didymodactylos carnosus]
MGICLGISLIVKQDYNAYDQLVRYKWWWKEGYMSSTGRCFDIGSATNKSLTEFIRRQNLFIEKYNIPPEDIDTLSDEQIQLFNKEWPMNCSEPDAAGNGALMRLAPLPLFFCRSPQDAIYNAGKSALLTHGDVRSADACRYYAALIVSAALNATKKDLLEDDFYQKCCKKGWFRDKPLHKEIEEIAQGSYKKQGGYDDGIRGKGYVVKALEAALWAFWSDENSFEIGALHAVNLGDDTDTTAAIYGQLAGVVYGIDKIPEKWIKKLYAKDFLNCLAEWLNYAGSEWYEPKIQNSKL